MSHCPTHPAIELPEKLVCPLCAQERRRKTYALQRAEGSQTLRWAAQRLLEASGEPVGDFYTQPSGDSPPEG